MQFGENALFERLEDAGIAEEGGFLGQQRFQQLLEVEIGLLDGAQEIDAAGVSRPGHVLAHTGGKESLARFVEADACPFLDQHADFTQFVFVQAQWAALV